MFSKMDAFIPKTSATLDDGTKSKLSPQDVEAFSKLGTMDDRVQAMRQNPEIAKQFLSTIEENQGKSAVRQIVKGDQKALDLEAAAAAIVTSQEGAKKDFDALVTVIAENTKNLQAANKSKAADQVTDPKLALEGSIIEAFNRAVDGMTNASGLDSFTRADAKNALSVRMASGQDAATAATTTLEELKQRETAFGFLPVGGSVSGEDQAKLDAQIAVIQELAGSVKTVEEKRAADRVNQFVQQKDANKDGKIGLSEMKDVLSEDMDQKNLDAMRGIPRAEGQQFVTVAQLQKALIDSGGISELIQLQRENNEILKGQAPANKQPAPPQKQRPQVAPLPAATAP
jgi:hypothetical protein